MMFSLVPIAIRFARFLAAAEAYYDLRLVARAAVSGLFDGTCSVERSYTPESLPYDTLPVEDAIEAGWVELLGEVDYANPVVSATMDMVRRHIAAADERAAHAVEQADAEVGSATATLLERGAATSVAVYTNDLPAFREIERALTEHGCVDRVNLVKSFDFFDRYQFQG